MLMIASLEIDGDPDHAGAPAMPAIADEAAYLHDGSVPTIAALLDSLRPMYWTSTCPRLRSGRGRLELHGRRSRSGRGDAQTEALRHDAARPRNAGHTFGDTLSAADHTAVLEYLKTL